MLTWIRPLSFNKWSIQQSGNKMECCCIFHFPTKSFLPSKTILCRMPEYTIPNSEATLYDTDRIWDSSLPSKVQYIFLGSEEFSWETTKVPERIWDLESEFSPLLAVDFAQIDPPRTVIWLKFFLEFFVNLCKLYTTISWLSMQDSLLSEQGKQSL